jgi:uncharacterized repeat protein (TIGR02543 family)
LDWKAILMSRHARSVIISAGILGALVSMISSCSNMILDMAATSRADQAALSTDADLSELTVSAGALSPAFSAETTAYSVAVENAISSITVTGTPADTDATVSGNSGVAQALGVGDNPITIAVTAADGTTVKNYVVTVTRAALSTNADLSELTVIAGALSPAFSAATTAYTVTVENAISSITVTGIPADTDATVSGNSGVAQALGVGDNPITIAVTAADGTTVKNYVVTVTRAALSTDADLSELTVSAGALSPAFSAETTAYSVAVENAISSITVTGIPADTDATVSGNSGVAQAIDVGDNPITIAVAAADGTTVKNYVVTVTRGAPTYTVTYDSQGATTEADPSSQTVTDGGNVGSLPEPPEKFTYVFDGWYTEANGGGTAFLADTAVDADITVYAKWTTNAAVTTLAGSGNVGAINGTGTSASFDSPTGVTVDSAGNVYVADYNNHLIRKITPGGDVTTLAGTSGTAGDADGTGTDASFDSPHGVTVDSAGHVYVADTFNHLIRRITPGGEVTTLAGSGASGDADGTGTSAPFDSPVGVTVDSAGNVYVADYNNHLIRKITPGGEVTTLAGSGEAGSADGTGTDASFNGPHGVTVDSAGNVYVADYNNHLIRKITPGGEVTTLAGTSGTAGDADGTSTDASFNVLME